MEIGSVRSRGLTIEAQWRKVNSPDPAAGGDDTAMPAELVQRVRQAAALEVLTALAVLWTEDELTIDIPETLEPESE
jgi:hypothetical protein